jgi:hypothetical protein
MEVFYFWIIACEAIIEKYHTLPPEAVSPALGIQESSEHKRFSAAFCHHERPGIGAFSERLVTRSDGAALARFDAILDRVAEITTDPTLADRARRYKAGL